MTQTGGFLDAQEAASWLQISVPNVRSLAAKGLIPGRKTGGHWTFSVIALSQLFGAGELPTVLTVDQAAHLLGKNRITIYRWLNNGDIPGVRLENLWRLSEQQLHHYFSSFS